MATSDEYLNWSDSFRKRVKIKMGQEKLTSQKLAGQLKIPVSTFSTQMNRSLKPWFVDRIELRWPDDFRGDGVECRRVLLGIAPRGPVNRTTLSNLMVHLHEIKRQAEEGIEAIKAVVRSEEGEESEEEPPHANAQAN